MGNLRVVPGHEKCKGNIYYETDASQTLQNLYVIITLLLKRGEFAQVSVRPGFIT